MSEQTAPGQEITVSDVLQVLGLKEVELQYERTKNAKASQIIAELRAELAKQAKG